MDFEELEIDARLLDIIENYGDFNHIDDDELIEIIQDIKSFNGGDYEEAYEYLLQYAPLDEKRFLSLCD